MNVRVHDIEYSWNKTHEDLAKLATALVPNGTPADPSPIATMAPP